MVAPTEPTSPGDMDMKRNHYEAVISRDSKRYNFETIVRFILPCVFLVVRRLPGRVTEHWAVSVRWVSSILMIKIAPVIWVDHGMPCSEIVWFVIYSQRMVRSHIKVMYPIRAITIRSWECGTDGSSWKNV